MACVCQGGGVHNGCPACSLPDAAGDVDGPPCSRHGHKINLAAQQKIYRAGYGKENPYDTAEDDDGNKIVQASRCEACERHRNQYDVIKISFNELSWKGKEYSDYIGRFQKMLEQDIREAYPALCGREFDSLPDLITASGGRFLFLIDEWDYIFSQENCREYHDDFLELLRDLLKDRPYVVFAYMSLQGHLRQSR